MADASDQPKLGSNPKPNPQMNPKMRILIAGGGTGGHIYPGLAIARAVQSSNANSVVQFVGSLGGMEERIIPREGFQLHTLSVGQLHHSAGLRTRIKTLLKLPFAFLKAAKIIFQFRPDAVLGVGGFASGPLVFLASLKPLWRVLIGRSIRTYLWEPNAQPGMTNLILSRWVTACLIVFDTARAQLHGRNFIKVGVPVRASIRQPASDTTVSGKPGRNFDLQDGARKLRIFVTGGSLGARAVNQLVLQLVRSAVENAKATGASVMSADGEAGSVTVGKIGRATNGDDKSNWFNKIELIHQTGKLDFQKLQQEYQQLQELFELNAGPSGVGKWQVQVLEFVHDMDAKYRWADLVISRSGASTVAEVCAARKAALFIPLPTAADNHQQKNAEVLVRGGAAKMLLQKDLTAADIQKVLEEFLQNPSVLSEYEARIAEFDFVDSDHVIAEILLGTDSGLA